MKPKNDLVGRRILAIVAPVNFRDEELFEPKAILESHGAKVLVASTTSDEAQGMCGGSVRPDLALDACRAEDYDCVFVVGGSGAPSFLWDDSSLHELVRAAVAKGKVVGAICLSTAALANAGVLAGRRATVYRTDRSLDALRDARAIYTGAPIEVDGPFVTASGPEMATRFGEMLARAVAAVPARAA